MAKGGVVAGAARGAQGASSRRQGWGPGKGGGEASGSQAGSEAAAACTWQACKATQGKRLTQPASQPARCTIASPAAAAPRAPMRRARNWVESECVSQTTILSANMKQQRPGVVQRMPAGGPPLCARCSAQRGKGERGRRPCKAVCR